MEFSLKNHGSNQVLSKKKLFLLLSKNADISKNVFVDISALNFCRNPFKLHSYLLCRYIYPLKSSKLNFGVVPSEASSILPVFNI